MRNSSCEANLCHTWRGNDDFEPFHRPFQQQQQHPLPEEPQERIAACLLGVELFALSHVNSDALRTFSQEHLWTSRLLLPDTTSLQDTRRTETNNLSQREYIQQCQSFSFPGRSQDSDELETEGGMAFVPVCSNMRDAFGSWGQAFSFETWFSLSSSDGGGGVLLGAQSISLLHHDSARTRATEEPSSYAQLVYVDTECNLFCSVVDCTRHGISPVAHALELHRWYHLALVYENNQRGESVYLNGELVRTVQGSLSSRWHSLYAAQLGTGYVVTTDSIGTSGAKSAGWHDFHGVVDSFRVFRFALSAASIRRIAAVSVGHADEGGGDGDGSELDEPTFCLKKRDFRSSSSSSNNNSSRVQRVRCSRPQERWCRVMRRSTVSEEDSLDSFLSVI